MKALLLWLAACDAGTASPYGNSPHVLGRLGALTVADHYADVVKKVPELKDKGVADLHDGAADYRLFYTQNGRVEAITAFLPGKASDVVSAWRHGVAGRYAGGVAATYWLDAASSTQYLIAEGRQPGEFFFAAEPYLPIAKIWDSGHDVRVFGLDLIGRSLVDDVAAINALGLEVEVAGQVAHRDGGLNSDAGKVEWSLEGDPVTKIAVQIGPYEIPSNARAIDDLFVEKWGTPALDHGTLAFHTEPHHVVEFHDKDVWITQ